MKKLVAFLTSKTFLANVILAGLFFVLVFLGLKWWLGYTTHHGEKIPVPELNGYTLSEAEEELAKLALSYRVIDSSEYNPELPLGSVVAQYPLAGSHVKESREILLTINPFVAKKIELPNVIEKTLRRAVYDLESKGFQVGELIYKPDIAKDVILELQFQNETVEPGARFEKGTVIDLIVGSGLSKHRVSVPYLKFLTIDEAEFKIKSNSLNLGLIQFDEDITDSATALVYKQSPKASHKPVLRMGAIIDIWLTNDSTKIENDSLQFMYPGMDIDSIRTNLETDTTFTP